VTKVGEQAKGCAVFAEHHGPQFSQARLDALQRNHTVLLERQVTVGAFGIEPDPETETLHLVERNPADPGDRLEQGAFGSARRLPRSTGSSPWQGTRLAVRPALQNRPKRRPRRNRQLAD
jgi:hypothetical protein